MSFSDPAWQAADWRMSGYISSKEVGGSLVQASGRLKIHVLRTKTIPDFEDIKRADRLRLYQDQPDTPPLQLDEETIEKFSLVSALLFSSSYLFAQALVESEILTSLISTTFLTPKHPPNHNHVSRIRLELETPNLRQGSSCLVRYL